MVNSVRIKGRTGHQIPRLFAAMVILIHITGYDVAGQDGRQYLSLGSDHGGLCFGNALRYDGVRVGFHDSSTVVNGMNLSCVSHIGSMNGLHIDLLGGGSATTNGVSLAGFVNHSVRINGVALTTIWIGCSRLNGAGTAFFVDVDTLNGFGAGFAIGPTREVAQGRLNGLVIGGLIAAERTNGLMIAILASRAKRHCGVSVAGFNQATELHGVQFGLLNYAGNNPKLLRWLPFMNFHP